MAGERPIDTTSLVGDGVSPAALTGRRWWRQALFGAVAAAVVGLDQATKYLVTSALAPGESWPPDWPVQATYTTNTGAAFGILQGQGALLTVIGLVGLATILLVYLRPAGHPGVVTVPLGLILGGAVGNVIDRLRLGHVIDFIDFPHWPAFNVADSSIVIGTIALAALLALASAPSRQPQ